MQNAYLPLIGRDQLVGLLAVLAVVTGCESYANRTADYLDRDLTLSGRAQTIARNIDFKPNALPLAGPMKGRRCGGVIGDTEPPPVAGRDREPLQSSIPWATDNILQGINRSYTFDRQMRQASIRHDFCYEHGASTFGKDLRDCDNDFLSDARSLCSYVNTPLFLPFCQFRAAVAYSAVRLFGGQYTGVKMSKSCEYENALGPARDAVLAGNFHKTGGDSLVYVRAEDSDALIVSVGDILLPGTRINLSEQHLSTPAMPLPRDPELWERSLAELGMRAQDFLHYTPQVVDIDGDGIDEILLVGIHRWSRSNLASGGLGLLFMMIRVGPQLTTDILLGTYLPPGPGERNACGPHHFSSRWCLTPKELLSAAEALKYPFIQMPALGQPGSQLAQISFDTSQNKLVTLRSFNFQLVGTNVSLKTTLVHNVDDHWAAGTVGPFTERNPSPCRADKEFFRRFQYQPLRFGSHLVTWFRDRCEDVGHYGTKAQPTMIGVAYDLSAEPNSAMMGKAVHIPLWHKAAIPMLPMAADSDAAKGMWAIYLSEKQGVTQTEVIKVRIRKGGLERAQERAYEISSLQRGHTGMSAIPPGALDEYFQYPLFSGFVVDGEHAQLHPAMLLFHITDLPTKPDQMSAGDTRERDQDKSAWRLLSIAHHDDLPLRVSEFKCPTPIHADIRQDREGMLTVPYRQRDGSTSFAIIVRDVQGKLNISQIVQDHGKWSVDGKPCAPLPSEWAVKPLELKLAE